MSGADYAPAIWMPADPSNYHRTRIRPTNLVVIHETDGHGVAQDTAAMWQRPGVKTSAHFVIGQDGTVVQCVALADVAWHAHQANERSVGVEHGCRAPGSLSHDDPGLAPSDALYASSARLVAWLCRRLGLPLEHGPAAILGHAEADPATTHKLCPMGCGWQWDPYLALVQAAYNAP